MLPFHLDRLWQSSEATGFGPAARAQGRQSLEEATVETIARVTESFRKENAGGGCPECMTTVLYTHRRRLGGEDAGEGLSDGDQPGEATAFTSAKKSERPREGAARQTEDREICIMVHAWPLPTPPVNGRPAGVEVLVAGSGRSLPEAKHSSWLRDRKPLDELKAQTSAQEVVLSEIGFSPEGATRTLLLEGLTSNFFVVEEDGAVCTAPSGVLLGGMRQLLISVCEKEGIEVRFDAPDISRAGRWREAFLTGTGRILAPVSTLLVPEMEYSSTVTRAARGSSAGMALSKIGIPCPPGNTATAGGKPVPSLAETVRSRMIAELGKAATQVF
ncbi:unnamed protein product [Ectocarpus fasciculatus]